MKKLLLPLAGLLAISGPARAMDEAAIRSAIQPRLKVLLRDADSAKIDLTRPVRTGTINIGVGGVRSGQIVCANVNATNGFGGYTGYKAYVFIIEPSGNVVALSEETTDGAVIARECQQPADPS